MVMNILSLLPTITFVMGAYTCSMRNPNHWTCLKPLDLIGGEYYDRYDGSGKYPESFVSF